MPARTQSLARFADESLQAGVRQVVRSADLTVGAHTSPADAHEAPAGAFPVPVRCFPIPDADIPADEAGFASQVPHIAGRLRAGAQAVLHGGAGSGRTGPTATCVLVARGSPLAGALGRVAAAGSRLVTPDQGKFVRRFAAKVDAEGAP